MTEIIPPALRIAGIFLEVLFIFNIIIVAHELGHFLAARARGLRVDKFALWFGPAIFKKNVRGVEWRVGCIPAGGFVSIPQMANPEFVEGGKGGAVGAEAKPFDKILVAAAGPVASLLCGFAFAVAVWAVGKPVHESETTTVVGYVTKGGPAERAGIAPGDKILRVNGREVSKFSGMGGMKDSVLWNVARAETPEISITLLRDGKVLEKTVVAEIPEGRGWGRRKLPQIGISAACTPVVSGIMAGGPAERADVRKGDILFAVNGERVYSYTRIAEIISGGGRVDVSLLRAGGAVEKSIVPEVMEGSETPLIGITWDIDSRTQIEHPDPFSQVAGAFSVMVETLSALFSPGSEVKAQHLSGPVGIMRLYYMLFEMPYGWRLALWFSVIFNVNLAVLNLLPIPVLDGGHILFSLAEWVRGKKISLRNLEILQNAFAILILGFMLYVTGYDLLDYLGDFLGQGK